MEPQEVFQLSSSRGCSHDMQLSLFNGIQFSTLNEAGWTKVLNHCGSALNSCETQALGMAKILACINKVEDGIVGPYLVKIFSVLKKICSRQDGALDYLTVQCLKSVLSRSCRLPEVSRELSPQIVGLITGLLAADPHLMTDSAIDYQLSVIADIMRSFSGPCQNARGQLRAWLGSLIGSGRCDVSLLVTCFALLPQLGGGGKEGIEHSKNWSQQYDTVLQSVNQLLSQLFQHVEKTSGGITHREQTTDSLFLPNLASKSNLEAQFMRVRQVIDLLRVLSGSLTSAFPQVRHVPVENLLKVITRILSIQDGHSSFIKDIPANKILQMQLPQLHSAALSLLGSLITNLEDDILPELATVNTLLSNVLQQSTHQKTKSAVYSVLSSCVQILGGCCGLELCLDKILPTIAADIIPPQDKVLLCGNKGRDGGGGGGKKKGRGRTKQPVQKASLVPQDQSVRDGALRFLGAIAENLNPLLSGETYRDIACLAVNTALSMPQQQNQQNNPFSVDATIQLYRLLGNLSLSPNSRFPSPLRLTVHILHQAFNHQHPGVSSAAKEANGNLLPILQPHAPSLHLSAVSEEEVRCIVLSVIERQQDDTQDGVKNTNTRAESPLNNDNDDKVQEGLNTDCKVNGLEEKSNIPPESQAKSNGPTENGSHNYTENAEPGKGSVDWKSRMQNPVSSEKTTTFSPQSSAALKRTSDVIQSTDNATANKKAKTRSEAGKEVLAKETSQIEGKSKETGSQKAPQVAHAAKTKKNDDLTLTAKKAVGGESKVAELDVSLMLKDFSDNLNESILQDPWDD